MILSKKELLLFVILMITAIFVSYSFIDRSVALYFISHVEQYEHIGDMISIIGQSHWYIASGVIGFVYFKYYKKNILYKNRFGFLLYANIFSGVISLTLKWIFGRMRPWGLRDGADAFGFAAFDSSDIGFLERIKEHFMIIYDAPTTYTSFPSGHTTTLFALFTYLSILFPRFVYLWLTLATIGASSRVLANDHFVSDLFAGAIVGVVSTYYIYSKMSNKI